MSDLVLALGTLSQGRHQARLRVPVAELGLPEGIWDPEVAGTLDIERTGDRISVRGRLEAVARLECVRCLEGFELPIDAHLEVFADRAGAGSRAEEEELERDDYMKFHDGRVLDLREDAREALILELPMAPRCREDCRGLCARCGADLNQGPCDCGANESSGHD